MSRQWSYSQHFSLRASTMLILYIPMLIGLGFLAQALPEPLAGYLSEFVGSSGRSLPWLLVAMWIFSLAFLIASVLRRNPQVQFALELIVTLGFGALWFSHVY